LTQEPEHFDLLDKIFHILMDMGKPADAFIREMGCRSKQVPILGIVCQGIGHGRRIDMGTRGRVRSYILNSFPSIKDTGP
jgi:hypothetical protein